jgi:hypothetical protein
MLNKAMMILNFKKSIQKKIKSKINKNHKNEYQIWLKKHKNQISRNEIEK